MSHFHNTPEGEKLALFWHELGAAAGVLGLILSTGAVVFHLWAVKEHREELWRLEEEDGT